jgi:hypothetical protein
LKERHKRCFWIIYQLGPDRWEPISPSSSSSSQGCLVSGCCSTLKNSLRPPCSTARVTYSSGFRSAGGYGQVSGERVSYQHLILGASVSSPHSSNVAMAYGSISPTLLLPLGVVLLAWQYIPALSRMARGFRSGCLKSDVMSVRRGIVARMSAAVWVKFGRMVVARVVVFTEESGGSSIEILVCAISYELTCTLSQTRLKHGRICGPLVPHRLSRYLFCRPRTSQGLCVALADGSIDVLQFFGCIGHGCVTDCQRQYAVGTSAPLTSHD